MNNTPVSVIMTKDPVTCTTDLPVDAALEAMTSNNVRRLPVVTKTRHVTGIITRYDATLALKVEPDIFGGVPQDRPLVRDVMTANVITIQSNDTIAHAARLMITHKIGGLPVVNESDELVGIVTESDLFRFLAEQLEAC
jgi:CBS domain-containing protein